MLRRPLRILCAMSFWLAILSLALWIRCRSVQECISLRAIDVQPAASTRETYRIYPYYPSGYLVFSWQIESWWRQPSLDAAGLWWLGKPGLQCDRDGFFGTLIAEPSRLIHFERYSGPTYPATGDGRPWGTARCGNLAFPIWFPAAAFSLPPLAWALISWLRRVPKGCCPVCRYDLRASKDRCPECGTKIGFRPRWRWRLAIAMGASLLLLAALAGIGILAGKAYLARGMDLWLKDEAAARQRELFDAVIKGDIEAVKRLLREGADARQASLVQAIAADRVDIARLLLESGTDPRRADDEGFTPLHLAIGYKFPLLAKRLIEKGADVRAATASGITPLHGCPVGDPSELEIEELLIAGGADVNAQDAEGCTPLHVAVASAPGEPGASLRGYVPFIHFLIAHGANPNLKTNEGKTPLFRAVEERNLDVIRALLTAGADPTIKCNDGRSAIDEARAIGHDEIMHLLETPPPKDHAPGADSDRRGFWPPK